MIQFIGHLKFLVYPKPKTFCLLISDSVNFLLFSILNMCNALLFKMNSKQILSKFRCDLLFASWSILPSHRYLAISVEIFNCVGWVPIWTYKTNSICLKSRFKRKITFQKMNYLYQRIRSRKYTLRSRNLNMISWKNLIDSKKFDLFEKFKFKTNSENFQDIRNTLDWKN